MTATVKFIWMIKFFDCLNVKNPLTGWHKRKAFQDPYIPPDDKCAEDEHLKVAQYAFNVCLL